MKSTYGAAMTVTFMNAWNNYLWPTIIFAGQQPDYHAHVGCKLKKWLQRRLWHVNAGCIDLYPSYRNYLSVLTKEFCQWNCRSSEIMNRKYCLDKKNGRRAQAALLLAKQFGLIEDAGIEALEKGGQRKIRKIPFMVSVLFLQPCIFNTNSHDLSWISFSPRSR